MMEKIRKIIDSSKALYQDTVGSDYPQNDSGKVAGLTTIYSPPKQADDDTCARDIADSLLQLGRITGEQLSLVRAAQLKDTGSEVTEILKKLGFADATDILAASAYMQGYEFKHIAPEMIDLETFERLERDFIYNNLLVPVSFDNGLLTVATAEPQKVFIFDELRLRTNYQLNVIVCTQDDIERVLAAFAKNENDYCVEELLSDIADVEVLEPQEDAAEDLEKMAGESPVIKFVNYLISSAIKQGASDIHIEPKGKETKIRYRIDGVLFEEMAPPAHMHAAMVSRLKIMSNLDISERRLPQDGKIAVVVGGRGIDLRVSCLPTTHGEKVVIRVLDSNSILRGLDTCGMDEKIKADFISEIKKPNGILLVTGPTGSGKSTTLYSSLGLIDGKSLNVSTVEDPVEYELGFANQVNVNDRIGMSFAAALRSLLRQDPDVIMVGEIRDTETARIAVQAALTGHLVLSTLHTNDAASSVTRLVNIGVEPYLISASLNAVLAQRLVRKICPNCKEPYKAPDNLRHYLDDGHIDPTKLFHGKGCEKCRQSGYVGRIGLYELMVVDEKFRAVINKDSSAEALKAAFNDTGAVSLYQDGLNKIRAGITTIDEVLRVTDVCQAKSEPNLTDNK